VWRRPSEGTGGQAVADRRTFCATTGAGYVRHGAFYVKSYTVVSERVDGAGGSTREGEQVRRL